MNCPDCAPVPAAGGSQHALPQQVGHQVAVQAGLPDVYERFHDVCHLHLQPILPSLFFRKSAPSTISRQAMVLSKTFSAPCSISPYIEVILKCIACCYLLLGVRVQ